MPTNLHPLCNAVQFNCNVADAQHASNYTLCVYLLKMREYYRWEKGFSYQHDLCKDELGDWVAAREHLWESLEESSFAPIEIDQQCIDPFDNEQINAHLIPRGLVYSGGIGTRRAPHFFLGRLAHHQKEGDFTILVSADECARDLAAPAAMTLGTTIFVRKESLRRWLWERIQEWQWNKTKNTMATALSFYDLENLEATLDQITETEMQTVIAHELGEAQAGVQLGPEWRELLLTLPRSRTEMMVRTVKDLYADAISTLPMMLQRKAIPSIHLYAANLTALHKELYPGFINAYQQFADSNDLQPLHTLVETSAGHWLALAEDILCLYRSAQLEQIESLINQRRL